MAHIVIPAQIAPVMTGTDMGIFNTIFSIHSSRTAPETRPADALPHKAAFGGNARKAVEGLEHSFANDPAGLYKHFTSLNNLDPGKQKALLEHSEMLRDYLQISDPDGVRKKLHMRKGVKETIPPSEAPAALAAVAPLLTNESRIQRTLANLEKSLNEHLSRQGKGGTAYLKSAETALVTLLDKLKMFAGESHQYQVAALVRDHLPKFDPQAQQRIYKAVKEAAIAPGASLVVKAALVAIEQPAPLRVSPQRLQKSVAAPSANKTNSLQGEALRRASLKELGIPGKPPTRPVPAPPRKLAVPPIVTKSSRQSEAPKKELPADPPRHRKLAVPPPINKHSVQAKSTPEKLSGDTQREQIEPSRPSRPNTVASLSAMGDSGVFMGTLVSGELISEEQMMSRAQTELAYVKQAAAAKLADWLTDAGKSGLLKQADVEQVLEGIGHQADADIENRFRAIASNAGTVDDRQDSSLPPALKTAQTQAGIDVRRAMVEAMQERGWHPHLSGEGNVEWEEGKGPLLLSHGLSLQRLEVDKADIGEGGFGSVSIYKNEHGDSLAGKRMVHANIRNQEGKRVDFLDIEFQGYKTVVDKVGAHPNLVNVYGIASVPGKNGKIDRVLLMDAVPGPNGDKLFTQLHQCRKSGKISHEQYSGALQFLASRLLEVAGHVSKAGITHNDIWPENILINERTGEPILVDLALWKEHGSTRRSGNMDFAAPEVSSDERSDVFMIGANMLDGVERTPTENVDVPADGLTRSTEVVRDEDGNAIRQPGKFGVDTAYTKFLGALMKTDKEERVNVAQAREQDYLADRMLDDDAAKEVIRNVIAMAKAEETKPKDQQWKLSQAEKPLSKEQQGDIRQAMISFEAQPNLALHAYLHRQAKADSKVKTYLESGSVESHREAIERDAHQRGTTLVARSGWFDAIGSFAKELPRHTMASGVDADGVRLNAEPQEHKKDRADWAVRAREKLQSNNITVDELRAFAEEAESYLRDTGTLGRIADPGTAQGVEAVRERAVIARKLVELDKDHPAQFGGGKAAPELMLDLRQQGWLDTHLSAFCKALGEAAAALETGDSRTVESFNAAYGEYVGKLDSASLQEFRSFGEALAADLALRQVPAKAHVDLLRKADWTDAQLGTLKERIRQCGLAIESGNPLHARTAIVNFNRDYMEHCGSMDVTSLQKFVELAGALQTELSIGKTPGQLLRDLRKDGWGHDDCLDLREAISEAIGKVQGNAPDAAAAVAEFNRRCGYVYGDLDLASMPRLRQLALAIETEDNSRKSPREFLDVLAGGYGWKQEALERYKGAIESCLSTLRSGRHERMGEAMQQFNKEYGRYYGEINLRSVARFEELSLEIGKFADSANAPIPGQVG